MVSVSEIPREVFRRERPRWRRVRATVTLHVSLERLKQVPPASGEEVKYEFSSTAATGLVSRSSAASTTRTSRREGRRLRGHRVAEACLTLAGLSVLVLPAC